MAPFSLLPREPEPERDFLERLDPDFFERLDPEPPLLLFLLSAIRDLRDHHFSLGMARLPIRSRFKRAFAFLKRLGEFDRCVATFFRSVPTRRNLDVPATSPVQYRAGERGSTSRFVLLQRQRSKETGHQAEEVRLLPVVWRPVCRAVSTVIPASDHE
jgi:hypothetical protein